MQRSSSPTDGSPSTPKRTRGRPKRELIERENLSKMLESDLSNDVSKRFHQKMNLLKVKYQLNVVLRIEETEIEAEILQF
jgi:hypothetical protein